MSHNNYEFITKPIDVNIFISMAIEGKMTCDIPIGGGKVRKIIDGVDYGEIDEEPLTGTIEYVEVESNES